MRSSAARCRGTELGDSELCERKLREWYAGLR
jgi:hypothetical protein